VLSVRGMSFDSAHVYQAVYLIAKCAIFEEIYLLDGTERIQRRLRKATINLYTAILVYLGHACRYYSQSTSSE
jgi:hypothetical protein